MPGREHPLADSRVVERTISGSSSDPIRFLGNILQKIRKAEIKPINETGEIVLNKVVIPEYIVVHDGPIGDTSAQDHYVRYKDYIKNVASSEIYATWPEDTIRANVLAIMSFTLNRVYTEWYRNKGYDFTITSSTAYDHKWIHGRNIFESIDRIVDELFEEVKTTLIDFIAENKGEQGGEAIDLIMVAKYLERIADHATNIAEWVEFSITGIHKASVV